MTYKTLSSKHKTNTQANQNKIEKWGQGGPEENIMSTPSQIKNGDGYEVSTGLVGTCPIKNYTTLGEQGMCFLDVGRRSYTVHSAL